ncbi:MAG TPA: glycosyltransferase family 2 protein [Desulfarculaceae bacterium]|nr:glycosyltransferase family 2 protein [Desulfarculaceae bacterium]
MLKCEWRVSSELPLDPDVAASVSVIIPCYRAAATIGRALASVAAQSHKPREVIIVDDASDDKTKKVLRELSEKYDANWLKVYFLPENCGPAAARNYGWEQAGQPFVAFLDADDSWHQEKIALQFGFMKRYPEVVLSGHDCGRESILVRRVARLCQIRPCTLKQLLWHNCLRTPTVMIKRAAVLHFPVDFRYGEDYYLWLGLLATGARAAFLDLPLAVVHKPAFGASGQSAALWRMEQGELRALQAVWRRGSVSSTMITLAMIWSGLKFSRRLLICMVKGRRA